MYRELFARIFICERFFVDSAHATPSKVESVGTNKFSFGEFLNFVEIISQSLAYNDFTMSFKKDPSQNLNYHYDAECGSIIKIFLNKLN